MLVDIAQELVAVDADLDGVPLAGLVMRAGKLLEDLPGEDIGPVEERQTEAAAGRVKAIVPILAVAGEDQAGGAGFIVELHRDGDLVGELRQGPLREAESAAAETRARAIRDDPARALAPAVAENSLPFGLVQPADREPA